MSVFGACIVGYRITASFRLQIVKHLDQHVQDVHVEAHILGLSYLKHSLVFSSIPFTCLYFLCSYVPVGDDECLHCINPFQLDPTKQQSRLTTGRKTY